MAAHDQEPEPIVVRIVYDGPPEAGKTTSVRALGRSFSRTVHTPAETGGRTTFFDWMEYVGGAFEGRQIRCQIVTVPGQPEFAARRKALLDTADAVVFVADTSDEKAVARSARAVRELIGILRKREGLPVGVLVQANKRDLPGAVSREEVRAALGEDVASVALTESVADAGVGIRETFVFAVRLALDRARASTAHGQLARARFNEDSAEQLLAAMEKLPGPGAPGPMVEEPVAAVKPVAAPPAEKSVEKTKAAAVEKKPETPRPADAPLPPDVRVPSGAIWPPVEGRMVLHEATTAGLQVTRAGPDEWEAGQSTGWLAHTAARFGQFDEARRELLAWARLHSSHALYLSASRCIVLAESGTGHWRLWQILRLLPSLRDWMLEPHLDASELLTRMAESARVLADAHSRWHDSSLLPTFDTVGRGQRGAQFVGLMPESLQPRGGAQVDDAVSQCLAGLVHGDLSPRRDELTVAIGQLRPAWTWADDMIAAALTMSG